MSERAKKLLLLVMAALFGWIGYEGGRARERHIYWNKHETIVVSTVKRCDNTYQYPIVLTLHDATIQEAQKMAMDELDIAIK